jgi:hypothetical protein
MSSMLMSIRIALRRAMNPKTPMPKSMADTSR